MNIGHYQSLLNKSEDELSVMLSEKVGSEYKDFITNMQQQNTATAIECAYEIVWKDNIACFFENEDMGLDKTQYAALLTSDNTLDEIYEDFLKNEYANAYSDLDVVIEDTAKWRVDCFAREIDAHSNTPVVMTLDEAGLQNYRNSRNENKACAKAIIAAKKGNTTYGDMAGVCYFNSEKTVNDVLAQGYPVERLGYVIATQVIRNQKCLDDSRLIDGRFSNKVKEWAIKTVSQFKDFPFSSFAGCDITSAMHHTLVNSLAESFIDKQNELNKSKGSERSNGKKKADGVVKE